MNTPVLLSTHIAKKTKRLYPLLFFTIILTGILQMGVYTKFGEFVSHPVSLMGFFLYVVGLQNVGMEPLTFNGPAWQLGILIIMDVAFYLLRKFRNYKLYFGGIMLLGAFIIYANLLYPFLYAPVGRGMVSFFAGVFIFNYVKTAQMKAAALCSVVLAICTILIIWLGTPIIGNMNMFFGVIYFPLLLIVAVKVPFFKNFIGNPLFVFMGKISYEIYLYQFPVIVSMVLIYRLGIFDTFYLYTPKALAIYIISTLLIAIISHYFLQDKIQKGYDFIVDCIFDGVRN